ncbi:MULTISPECIES: CsbD family protein [Acidocella]|uniref:CsbD family protein n=1 Tax=Acidocella TaxID=50709 RepID=UPI00028CF28F|nr:MULTISPECIES: CsbD family protein [Acidocella]EKM99124.1 CsbD family protein [Acidocella sp. MX-AZ02]WBO57817.1 CsbD family protein [Acidocella sp. MX-AZ03]
MDENEIKGAAREFGGRVQDALGGLTGDAKTQAEGKWNQAAGQAQRSFGATVDDVIENVKDKPLAALAAVAGVSFLAGWLMRK